MKFTRSSPLVRLLAYLKHNQEMQDYVTDHVKKLQDTLDSYTSAEQASADHARLIQNRCG